ncbi:MAG: hypothetical protein M1838_005796 [Thelocarpon superellum]|nr:MAG: hypothetical protein M1838_005796 [Thelocarpon superellum]
MSIIFGAGGILYSNYIYKHYIVDQFSAFPEPVAVKLRRALYYSNIAPSPKDAVRYYREALEEANRLGMDPFSDEVIGIKIQLAAFVEKIQQYKKAIEVLELVRGDCLGWLEERGGIEGNEGQRTRVLSKLVGMSVKLADLYANPYIKEPELAEERLIWAVETVLKERKRREVEGVREGEGEWMSNEEVGGALEALANNYEAKDQHYLAAPLYLQALTLAPPNECHSVILMNNLSTSLAQQVPPSSLSAYTPPANRTNLIESGQTWARKAIERAAKIAPPDRTPDCDLGCAVATHNLGEFAEMQGDVAAARAQYVEAESLAKALGFQEGMNNARAALERVGRR